MRGSRTACLVAAAHLIVGCATPPVAGGPPAGAWILVEVGGASLPAVQMENEFGRRWIESDTLWFDGRGSGRRRALVRSRSADGETTLRDEREDFRYRVESSRLFIEFDCPGFFSFALCAGPPHGAGEVSGDTMVLTFSEGAPKPLVYRRIR